jgi:hypothetical protein
VGLVLVDDGLEAAAADELHGEEVRVFVGAGGVDLDDVVGADGGEGAGLALEVGGDARAPGVLGGDELEGDGAAELDVAGAVDDAHGAPAELASTS